MSSSGPQGVVRFLGEIGLLRESYLDEGRFSSNRTASFLSGQKTQRGSLEEDPVKNGPKWRTSLQALIKPKFKSRL